MKTIMKEIRLTLKSCGVVRRPNLVVDLATVCMLEKQKTKEQLMSAVEDVAFTTMTKQKVLNILRQEVI